MDISKVLFAVLFGVSAYYLFTLAAQTSVTAEGGLAFGGCLVCVWLLNACFEE